MNEPETRTPWRAGDTVFWDTEDGTQEGEVEADERPGKNLRVVAAGRVWEHNPRLVRAEP
jgi:hypothetical protein